MARARQHPLTRAVRAGLKARANARRAREMQVYMKSKMPFAGVASPVRSALERELFSSHPLSDATTWRRVVLELWRGARYREERYAALSLLLSRRYRKYLTVKELPLLEELIVSGAWWDYVDPVASHGLGHLLALRPAAMKRQLKTWARSQDMWKRRAAIISQLRAGEDTDTAFLEACITPNFEYPDFFVQKAIGWALRQYAWKRPAWVKRWVSRHHDRLSTLGRREALKNIGRS